MNPFVPVVAIALMVVLVVYGLALFCQDEIGDLEWDEWPEVDDQRGSVP